MKQKVSFNHSDIDYRRCHPNSFFVLLNEMNRWIMSAVYFGHDFYKIVYVTVFVTKFKLKILIKRTGERSCKNHVKVVFCIASMHTF